MTVSPSSTPAFSAATRAHHPGAATPDDTDRKLVILTGASGGIGALIAQDLIARGYRLVALCRSRPALDPSSCLHIPCDLASPESLSQACARIRDETDRVFALIHCAGTITPSPMLTATGASIDAQIALNLVAPMLLTRHILPLMGSHAPSGTVKGAQAGRIVFVNSMAAVMPLAGSAVYAATKAGLRSFALSLAQEVGPAGIRVGSVFPGAVQTDMLAREMAEGGSILNYVSTPLAPEAVARAVVAQIGRGTGERFLPAMDGLFGKLCMLMPALLRLTLPLLGFLGRRGYRRSCRRAP